MDTTNSDHSTVTTMKSCWHTSFWIPNQPLAANANDYLRVFRDGDLVVAALTRALDGPFTSFWAPGSRHLLDLFTHAWHASSGLPRDRLALAYEKVHEDFFSCLRDTFSNHEFGVDGEHDGDAWPDAVLMVAVLHQDTVWTRWVGGERIVVLRDGQAVFASQGQMSRDTANNDNTTHAPTLLMSRRDGRPSSEGECVLMPGDHVVLMTSHVAQHVPITELEALASVHGNTQALSERISSYAISSQQDTMPGLHIVSVITTQG